MSKMCFVGSWILQRKGKIKGEEIRYFKYYVKIERCDEIDTGVSVVFLSSFVVLKSDNANVR